ncbi:unnamed protein product [Anisakis simplex]|uniref:SANT domain-containing protein n=1 Tax=Anisakis simplex TaxID=6269 RepID=A0A0M3JUN2_ANISI|nr:unnamed protein product [Anisakis simplex]
MSSFRSVISGGTSSAYTTTTSSSPACTPSVGRLTDPSTISLVNTPTSAANNSNTSITPSSSIPSPADQQQLRTLSLPQSNRGAALPQKSTQPALVRNRQIFSQQLMRQNAAAQFSSEQQHQRTSSYSPYSSSSNLMSVGAQRWRPQQQPGSAARVQNTYRTYPTTYEMPDRVPISRNVYNDYRHQREDSSRVYPTAVPSSARSRLVPLDPSPNIYFSSQPTTHYRSYIMPRQQHSARTSVRRIPSVTRHPVSGQRQQQPSSETAAAVASIASSLGDDSKSSQDTQDEDAVQNELSADFGTVNVVPSVSVFHQPPKQIDHSSHRKVSVECAPGPSSSVSVPSQRVNIASVHRRFPTAYHPNTSSFIGQKTTAERSDYTQYDTNNEQQTMSTNPSSFGASTKPKILPSVVARSDASVSRVVRTEQDVQPLAKQQRTAGGEDGLSLLADTATASQGTVVQSIVVQRPVQTAQSFAETDERALVRQSSSPTSMDDEDAFDLPKTIRSQKLLTRELPADPVAAASQLINYGFELEDSD